jgi:hypothetical protein
MSMILDGSNGVTFNDASLQGAAASPYVLKNRIINGAMTINQRGFSGSITTSAYPYTYTLDRWQATSSQASKYTVSQSSTAPTDFSNSLLVTSSAATTLAAGDFYGIQQTIEGFNFYDLNWGTVNAKAVTLSFWVYSSLTGTFGGSIYNYANTASYPFTYSISAANTWTKITINVTGATVGSWGGATNSGSAAIIFNLGAGSTYSGTANTWASALYLSATGATSVVGTNGATFYITGVQLEQNTSATPFERRLYNQELANCQRYYWQQNYTGLYEAILDPARAGATNNAYGTFCFPVTMRSAPSVSNNGVGNFRLNDSKGNDQVCNGISAPYVSDSKAVLIFTKATANFTIADCVYINTELINDASLYFSAEL